MLGANSSTRTEDLASKSPPDSETKISAVPLFTASAAALFVELVLIRWIPSAVHVVGFFANVVLIASFLGLGVGMMGARHNPGQAAIYRLATLVGVLTVYRLVDPSVQLAANTSYGINEVVFTDRVSLPLPLILIGVFSLVAWALIPFGRLIAAHFDQHERIRAYTTNIGGSLVGVGAFTIVSALGWPSIIWFLGLVAFVALHAPARSVLIGGVSIVIALGAVYYVDSNQFESMVLWSPYNQLRVHAVGAEIDDGFVIEVNNQFLLSGLDLSTAVVVDDRSGTPTTGDIDLRTYYDFPFELANPGKVLVLGGGVVGAAAARIACGMGADVIIMDIDLDRMRYLEDIMPRNVTTLYSDPHSIREHLGWADLLIGAVLLPGAKAPHLVRADDLKRMKKGSVIVDVSIDQGGCVETSRVTTHGSPTFVIDDVVHYCVGNMPGAVSRTSTQALTNATTPWTIRLANDGPMAIAERDAGFAMAINIDRGKLLNEPVARAHSLEIAGV